MPSMMKNTLMTAAICALAAPVSAADVIVISQQTTTGAKSETSQTHLDRNRMRAETADPTGNKRVVVFDGAAQVLRIIDDQAKTYREITKADVDRLGGMPDVMTQMQQQMQNLPPEQRAQIEAMMKARGGISGAGGPSGKTEYKKVGTDRVGKWTCDKYEGVRNGQKTSEVCTVDPKVLGFTAADLEVPKQLAEFFSKLMPHAEDRMFRVGTGDDKSFAGVPVRTVSLGPQPSVTEVTDVSRQSLPDSTFAVPAGYQKTAFGGRGRQ